MRKHLTTVFLALGLMATAGAAPAQEVAGFAFPGSELGASAVQPGQIYGGATKSVLWMEVPEWTYGRADSTQTPGPPEFDINADGIGLGINGFIGLGLDLPLGRNPRLQLSGGYQHAKLEGAAPLQPSIPNDLFVLLDGTSGFGVANRSRADLQVDHEAFEFALRALSDFDLGPGVVLTPSVMVFGGGVMQDYDADVIDSIPAPIFESFVQQEVDAYQVGVEAALAGTFTLADGLALVFGGRGSVLHLDADLDGNDCRDGNTTVTGCQPALTSSVSDTFNRTTWRAGLFGGTTFDLGPHLWNAAFSVFGSIDWMPYAAIKNPRFAGDAPSHLVLRHEMQYAISAGFTVPLN